ncbi:hypothetical protein HYC85_024416 [Camellia sinensis]|uniref:Uncharacterized protein n=1 Tax=Camellia sinensis TaxID=4442 RepID=A0A7J7G817_CAMSI|nr:hypothetical protein HYC85_024416 [Camellia sinensis]
MVELHSRCPFFPTPDLVSLINQCNPTTHNFFVNPTGLVAGILFFRHCTDAAEAIVFFWERRIAGDHFMTPVSEVLDDELQERVKGLFVCHVESLLEGEVMQRMVKKREVLQNEAENLSARLRKPQKLGLLYGELPGKAKGLRDEIGLITNRMEEFRSAMKWILNYLQGNNSKDSVISGETEVFKFEDGLDLSRIHCIVMRECRRLEEGLPIYGFRLDIIRKVRSEQKYFIKNTIEWACNLYRRAICSYGPCKRQTEPEIL